MMAATYDDLQLPPLIPPQIIRRAQWNARPPDHRAQGEAGLFHPHTNPGGWLQYTTPLDQMLNTIVVHHSALAAHALAVADIQRLHIEKRGFADIAYHFVVAAGGQLYEGRVIGVRGAHVRAANTGTVGLVLLGNFEEHRPTTAQIIALHHLVGDLAARYTAITHLAAHYEFNRETVCPGAALYPLLPKLAATHQLQPGPAGYQRPPWA